MDEPRILADVFGQLRQESDDVVFGFAFDGVDPSDSLFRIGLIAVRPHGLGRLFGDNAQVRLAIAGMGLDFVPDAEFVGGFPDGGHLGTGIAWDHRNCSLCKGS